MRNGIRNQFLSALYLSHERDTYNLWWKTKLNFITFSGKFYYFFFLSFFSSNPLRQVGVKISEKLDREGGLGAALLGPKVVSLQQRIRLHRLSECLELPKGQGGQEGAEAVGLPRLAAEQLVQLLGGYQGENLVYHAGQTGALELGLVVALVSRQASPKLRDLFTVALGVQTQLLQDEQVQLDVGNLAQLVEDESLVVVYEGHGVAYLLVVPGVVLDDHADLTERQDFEDVLEVLLQGGTVLVVVVVVVFSETVVVDEVE